MISLKIKGRIIQKIPPKRLKHYCEPWYGFIPEKWHVTIAKPGVPIRKFKRFIYAMKRKERREEGLLYHVALDSCPYKKGDFVEFDVEEHVISTPLFIEKKKGGLKE